MDKLQEYFVFYLRVEYVVSREDMLSLNVREESIAHEMEIQNQFVDLLSDVIRDWDSKFKQVESYASGVGTNSIKCQHFGPMFVAYLPKLNKESVKSLYALMAFRLPSILRKMGTRGRLIRGAFVSGYGWEIDEGTCHTLYGPVMQKAWDTMTEKAYSPRIIIDEDIFNVVSSRDSYGKGEDGDWLPIYAKRSYDGQGIFDYLAYDEESPSLQSETKDSIVKDMMTALATILMVSSRLAMGYAKHDGSKSVRMLLALTDYIRESICDWTGKSHESVTDEAFRLADQLWIKTRKVVEMKKE